MGLRFGAGLGCELLGWGWGWDWGLGLGGGVGDGAGDGFEGGCLGLDFGWSGWVCCQHLVHKSWRR